MTLADFHTRYQAGQMGDNADVFEWNAVRQDAVVSRRCGEDVAQSTTEVTPPQFFGLLVSPTIVMSAPKMQLSQALL